MSKKYKKNAEMYRGNLREAGAYYYLDTENVQPEIVQKMLDDGVIVEDERPAIRGDVVDLYGLDPDAVDSYPYYDEEEEQEIYGSLMAPASAYLAYLYHARWDGLDGYLIKPTFAQALQRSYESCIRPRTASEDGKVLICTESSHDVPGGSRLVIIGLTQEEEDELRVAEFDEVKDFVELTAESVKEDE